MMKLYRQAITTLETNHNNETNLSITHQNTINQWKMLAYAVNIRSNAVKMLSKQGPRENERERERDR